MAAPASAPAKPALLLVGATGAVGKALVAQLLATDPPLFGRLVVLTRRPLEQAMPGLAELPGAKFLREVHVDFDNLGKSADAFQDIDVAISCLGTTRRDAGSAEAFRKVDRDYIVETARLVAAANPRARFINLTAVGSNPRSWLLYPRTKGEAEAEVAALMPSHVLRPGLLERGADTRGSEKVMHVFAKLAPSQVISVAGVATCIRQLAFAPGDVPASVKSAKLPKPDGRGVFDTTTIYEHAALRAMAAAATV